MEQRPLGRTGLRVSEIGVCLPPDAALAVPLARRAADEGVTFFVTQDPTIGDALPDAIVAVGPRNGAYVVAPGAMGIAADEKTDVASLEGIECLFVPFNLVEQELSVPVMAPAARRGLGIVATRVLGGGSYAGRLGHAPPGAAVEHFRTLIKPRRTLAQAALLFALANEYVSCALVRVSSAEHLMEALGAADAEPLAMTELEHIFETYANRYDRK